MNDFTKEELHVILAIFDKFDEFKKDEAKVYVKVQSMIDNYECHHESDGMVYTSYPPQNKCKKCGEFYR